MKRVGGENDNKEAEEEEEVWEGGGQRQEKWEEAYLSSVRSIRPQVPVWVQVPSHYRLQTTCDYSRSKERDPILGSSLTVAVGYVVGSVQLWHQVQVNWESWKCQWTLRLPLPSTDSSPNTHTVTAFNIWQVQVLPVTWRDIQQATRRDTTLSKVLQCVQQSWPNEVNRDLQSNKDRQTELSTDHRCLVWGFRVGVPKSLQSRVLESLQANHTGITWMKAIAHSHFWRKGLDKDIETLGKSCHPYQSNQSNTT